MGEVALRAFSHIVTVVVLLAVFLVLPAFLAGVRIGAAPAEDVDAVSSATAVQEAPSGKYTIFINRDMHDDPAVLDDWVSFFKGEATPLIMEDITCIAAGGDTAGIEMAESLRSRLPENQMTVVVEDGVLALSKADAGKFDALVLSDETAESLSADTLYDRDDVEVVHR